MAAYPQLTEAVNLGSFDISGTNDAEYIPGRPVNVYGVVLVFTVASSGATPTVIDVYVRPTPGSTSGQVDQGSFSIAGTGHAAGSACIVYFGKPAAATVGSDGSTVNAGSPPDPIEVDASESLFFDVDGGLDGGTVNVIALVNPQALTPGYGRSADVTEVTFTPA